MAQVSFDELNIPDSQKYYYIMQQYDVDQEIKDILKYLVEEKGDYNGVINFTMFRDNIIEMWKDGLQGIDMLYELFPQIREIIDTQFENERTGRLTDIQKYNMIIRMDDVGDDIKEMLAEMVQLLGYNDNWRMRDKPFDFIPFYNNSILPLWEAGALGIDILYELFPQLKELIDNFPDGIEEEPRAKLFTKIPRKKRFIP